MHDPVALCRTPGPPCQHRCRLLPPFLPTPHVSDEALDRLVAQAHIHAVGPGGPSRAELALDLVAARSAMRDVARLLGHDAGASVPAGPTFFGLPVVTGLEVGSPMLVGQTAGGDLVLARLGCAAPVTIVRERWQEIVRDAYHAVGLPAPGDSA